jgi:hypothetical protein
MVAVQLYGDELMNFLALAKAGAKADPAPCWFPVSREGRARRAGRAGVVRPQHYLSRTVGIAPISGEARVIRMITMSSELAISEKALDFVDRSARCRAEISQP